MEGASSNSRNTPSRLNSYKHRGKDSHELRRQRHTNAVSLRRVIRLKFSFDKTFFFTD